jgi:hypothetical protein
LISGGILILAGGFVIVPSTAAMINGNPLQAAGGGLGLFVGIPIFVTGGGLLAGGGARAAKHRRWERRYEAAYGLARFRFAPAAGVSRDGGFVGLSARF